MAEGSAAVTAAKLLAFCKDPVRYRPRLTHGREIPAGGLHAFRFAQGKFPNGLLRDLPAPERERLRRAANLYIRQICFWDGATHYQVLGVPKDSRRETIKDHYHGLIALIHPDRQEPDSEHWPPEAAQRVNLAYAVLSDEARRAEYDAELHKAALDRRPLDEEEPPPPKTTAVRVPLHGKFAAAKMRLRKPALFGGLAIASLFYLQMWLASQVVGDFSTLQSATPLQLTFQWVRNVFSGVDRPRFLGGAESNAALQSAANDARAREEPQPALAFPRAAPMPAPLDLPREVARAPETAVVSPGQPTRSDAATLRVPGGMPSTAAGRTPSQRDGLKDGAALDAMLASARPSTSKPTVDSVSMEILVSRLVTYYETGDLVRFLALFDADSLGFWESRGVRRDFEDFFAATKSRQLRFDHINWEFTPGKARAAGLARLVVEYKEESQRIERTVAVELDVVDRGGNGKIARISLFPREKAGP